MFNELIEEWGVSKSLQIILLAAAAASIVVVIGTSYIPNKPNKKEKDNNETRDYE